MDTHNQNKEYWLNQIIDRLTGAISESSDKCLEEWICSSDENALYFESIQKVWKSMEAIDEEQQFDSNRAFLLFKERIIQETQDTAKRKKKHFALRKALSYVAILIPFLLLSYFSYNYFHIKSEKHPLLLSEVVVPNGSKTQLTLQDGSKIWLNAGSKIQYDSDFGKKSRILKLSGEAYLEVTKNKECPFIVDAGEIKIKVLGTRFNISAYEDNDDIKVALLQGSIEMKAYNGSTLQLAPKDIACFNKASNKIDVHKNSHHSGNAIDWISNRLIFNGENFEDIIHTLERSFNVKINIRKQEVRNRRFVGDFVNNETIEQIFNVMSADGKFKYTIKGNVIDVY